MVCNVDTTVRSYRNALWIVELLVAVAPSAPYECPGPGIGVGAGID